MIKGIIFDYDGLMMDTESLFLHEAVKLMKQRNMDLSEDVLKKMIGVDHRKAIELNQIYPGLLDMMTEYMSNRKTTFPLMFPDIGDGDKTGLIELIAYLNDNSIPYVIASGSPSEDIKYMNTRSLADIQPVAILSTREEHVLPKPHPDIFLLAAKRMNLKPEEILVLEDGKYGILAAQAGGFASVFIQDKIVPDEEMQAALQFIETDLLAVKEGLKEHRYDK